MPDEQNAQRRILIVGHEGISRSMAEKLKQLGRVEVEVAASDPLQIKSHGIDLLHSRQGKGQRKANRKNRWK